MKRFAMVLGLMLALVGITATATLPGCAFLQQQRQTIATMSQVDFDKLKADVKSTSKLVMDQGKAKLSEEQKVYAITAFKIIKEKSNAERAKLLAAFFEDPAHRQLGQLAIQGALEVVEGVTGERLVLASLGLSPREVELVDAALEGLIESLEE